MTSCLNLFPQFFFCPLYHPFISLSWVLSLSAYHQSNINTFSQICPLLSPLSTHVFLLYYWVPSESCQNRIFFSLKSKDLQLQRQDPSPTASCKMISFCLVSSPSFVRSLTVLALFLSLAVFLSPFPSAFCHSPLSNFHKSICWPTGCVTDSAL